MGCAEGLVRFLVFGANLIFALGGLILIVVGVVYKLNIQQFTELIPAEEQNIKLVPVLTIVVGVIIFVIAFFGCCGAIRESPCLLTTYSIILMTLFLLQIAVGVYAFLEIKDEDALSNKITGVMNKIFNKYNSTSGKTYEIVDFMQQELECCGTEGPNFWNTSIPDSCYEDGKISPKHLYKNGCIDEFIDYLTDSVEVIGITVLALSSLEISGASLVAIGVLLKMKNTDIQNFIPDKYHLGLPPLLLIVIGAAIFITASFGCCGAIKENTCMLTTFAIILLTLLIIQVAIGAFAFLLVGDTQDLRESVRQVVKNSFNDYNNTKLVKDEFDFLQTFLECCGVDRPQDWNWANEKLPDSCCASRTNCTLKSGDCYRKGCAENSYKWFKNGLDLLGILAIAVASIELIGAIFALCLSSSIKNQLRREAYA